MTKSDTTKLRIEPDGSTVHVLPDGSTEPYRVPEPDHARLDTTSDQELTAAALADPDNPPLSDAQLARIRRDLPPPDVKSLRARLRLTQAEFARRYRIPVGNIRDWEQGRTRPDAATVAYLLVIEREPEVVRRALDNAAGTAAG